MKRKIVGIFVLMLLSISNLMVVATDFDQAPSTPIIEGPSMWQLREPYTYTVISTDPQGDALYYEARYSDDPSLDIRGGPFKSGEKITFVHCWDDFYQDYNPFVIQVMAVDEYDHESDWGIFEVNLTNTKSCTLNNNNQDYLLKTLFIQLLEKLIERIPLLERILTL